MTLSQFTHKLQALCHEGHAQDEVILSTPKGYIDAECVEIRFTHEHNADMELADYWERNRE
jgi:hypothetical protein